MLWSGEKLYRTPRMCCWSTDSSIAVRLLGIITDNGFGSKAEDSYRTTSFKLRIFSLIKYISDESWTLTSQNDKMK